MKTTTIATLLILFLFSSATIINKEEASLKISSSEVLEKCIKHYNPNDVWNSFKGKVNIKTIFPKRSGEEVLEINNATGFYQTTRLNSNEKIVKGTKDGECFQMINDNSDLTAQQIKDNNLTCESIRMMKEHHTCHFGFLMNMEKAGLKINSDVSEEYFNGWDCYAISFSGSENEVIHDYYLGEVKLFIDKNNYLLRGKDVNHPNFPKRKIVYNGELKVNNIIMPEVVIYYDADNPQYAFVDIFTSMEN